jgi:hypothetical protein
MANTAKGLLISVVFVALKEDMACVGLSAGGFLDHDIFVSAYRFGEEDPTEEDLWVEEIAHSGLADDFYQHGFRLT